MPPSDLRQIREEIGALRSRGGVRSSELQRLARRLGRTLSPRGKHPTWVSRLLPAATPLSIPDHGGKELNRYTARAILDQMEQDLNELERRDRRSPNDERS